MTNSIIKRVEEAIAKNMKMEIVNGILYVTQGNGSISTLSGDKATMELVEKMITTTTEDTIEITRTGEKMLTATELKEMKNKSSLVSIPLISSFATTTDKGKEVLVELYADGKIEYYYMKNGKRSLKCYYINTPEFKFVLEENKTYKKELPVWVTAEQLKAMY